MKLLVDMNLSPRWIELLTDAEARRRTIPAATNGWNSLAKVHPAFST